MTWTPISKAYVFSTLLGDPVPVGVIVKDEGIFSFAYAKSWLANPIAYALDPLHIPLDTQTFQSNRLFGVLADSLPDNWGQRVILATHKQAPANEIEWLLSARGRGVGALAFSASRSKVQPSNTPPKLSDLDRVLTAMDDIQASRPVDDPELIHLIEYGSSFGGARPKTIIQHEDTEWLAKLSRHDDTFDQIGAEAASLAMAKQLGLDVPNFQVHMSGKRPVLLVSRFDRESGQPSAHYLSGQSALATRKIQESDFAKDYSYQGLATVIRKLSSQPKQDLTELFTRMAFNVAIGNTDDHLKNHGFLFKPDQGWSLAPAFDLLPHPNQIAQHAIGIGVNGRSSTISNLLSRSSAFGLSDQQANRIVDQVLSIADEAHHYFGQYGVPETDNRVLSGICQRFSEDDAGTGPSP
ncbi:type II toxin-antitoxin system HipA family toxin [Marinobacter sp. ELB17]|uniref:type II toxin-antitoxin system HipA family toxin n=1 Tax=Marinobacter sp. ELB17 TaxID=270374 RepID=UPI0000F36AA3|nr:type II toxin-antitoxin system HipA family toxin [Marinobacter sp. ELB17]EAZ97472.1 Amidophosphoribosyl transferase [Marinobacter sp. ELB17]